MKPLKCRRDAGLTLLEVVLSTALLSLAAVSLLNWLDASRIDFDERSDVVVGTSLLDLVANEIVNNPSRFGVPRASDGSYRWDAAGTIEDQRRQIEGRFEIEIVRTDSAFDRLIVSDGDASVTRWYIKPPDRRRP